MDEYAARGKLELDRRPLPENWQSKWVPSAKRFVFINHSTRTTTWNDPRPVVAMPMVGPSGHSVFSQLNKDPMKDLKEQFPDAPDDVLQQCWQSSGQNKPIVVSQIKSMGYTDKLSSSDSFELKGMTSAAGNDYSTGMYSTSFVSPEAEARRKREEEEAARKKRLEAEAKRKEEAFRADARRDAAAKKAAADKSVAARIAAANKKAADKKAADKRAADQRAAAAAAKKPTRSPPKPKVLSAAEKKRIEKRMAQAYKDIPAETINMVLESFAYDEMRTKMVLDGERVKASQPSGGGSSAASAAAASGSHERQAFVAPALPAFASDDLEPLPSTNFNAQSAASYLDRKPGYAMPPSAGSGDFFSSLLGDKKKQSVPWSTTKGSSVLSARTPQKETAQPATEPSMDPTQMLGAFRDMDYKAVGANSELTNGADSELLQDKSGLARGRNPYLASGPQKQLRVGATARPAGRSTLAVGKARLANGSDPEYHVGPDLNRRKPLLKPMPEF